MNAEALLRELVEVHVAKRAKFVPYDLNRRLKRREETAWKLAEEYITGVKREPVVPLTKRQKGKADTAA